MLQMRGVPLLELGHSNFERSKLQAPKRSRKSGTWIFGPRPSSLEVSQVCVGFATTVVGCATTCWAAWVAAPPPYTAAGAPSEVLTNAEELVGCIAPCWVAWAAWAPPAEELATELAQSVAALARSASAICLGVGNAGRFLMKPPSAPSLF